MSCIKIWKKFTLNLVYHGIYKTENLNFLDIIFSLGSGFLLDILLQTKTLSFKTLFNATIGINELRMMFLENSDIFGRKYFSNNPNIRPSKCWEFNHQVRLKAIGNKRE
jgi:hypothetical protein